MHFRRVRLLARCPDFLFTDTSSIIQEFSRQLSLNPQSLSLEEQLRALSYIFASQLTALANVLDGARQAINPLHCSVQLTVAGYDVDGSPKIAQVTLQNTASLLHVGDARDDQWMEFARPVTVTKIGGPLVARLAGLRDEDVRFDVMYPIVTTFDTSTLYVKGLFTHVVIHLDGNYFSGDTFNYALVMYDGGEAMRFGNNNVKESVLIIGPHAKRDSENMKHLLHDLCWLQVVYEEPKTNGRSKSGDSSGASP